MPENLFALEGGGWATTHISWDFLNVPLSAYSAIQSGRGWNWVGGVGGLRQEAVREVISASNR